MKQPSGEIVGMINSPEREEQVCGDGKGRRKEGKGKVGVNKEERNEGGEVGREEGDWRERKKRGRKGEGKKLRKEGEKVARRSSGQMEVEGRMKG